MLLTTTEQLLNKASFLLGYRLLQCCMICYDGVIELVGATLRTMLRSEKKQANIIRENR